jgi:hypothetical protein
MWLGPAPKRSEPILKQQSLTASPRYVYPLQPARDPGQGKSPTLIIALGC